MKALAAIVALSVAGTAPACSEEKKFDHYWAIASHAPGAVTKEYPHATAIIDEKNLTVYIFTKPGNPSHPGVIVRTLDAHSFHTTGYSDGPDSAQDAFKAWMNNPFQ